ncbi:ribonuclease T2-A-like isoform X1 [Rhinoraja longicauda]
MGLPFLLLLFLVAASCSGKSNLGDPTDNVLVLSWPPNACKVKKWTGRRCEFNWWTIHGWWPPQGGNVNKHDFIFDKIKDLLPRLNIDWPDLAGHGTLWPHEWNTHGKCATQTLTVKKYFKEGLNYYSRVESCVDHKPENAKACFDKLPSVKRCDIIWVTVNGTAIITQAHLYLK